MHRATGIVLLRPWIMKIWLRLGAKIDPQQKGPALAAGPIFFRVPYGYGFTAWVAWFP
jgi:hypothetical protein